MNLLFLVDPEALCYINLLFVDVCVYIVQGLYANIHLHDIGSEMQGARGGEASESRCCRLFPSPQEVMKAIISTIKDSNV
jgi:hypothetical protein